MHDSQDSTKPRRLVAGLLGLATAVAIAIASAMALKAKGFLEAPFNGTTTSRARQLRIDTTDPVRIARGKQLYAQQCASCHGANLEGQPNWRDRLPNGRLGAPPHDATGHTWHHPDAVLFAITRDGLVPGVTAPADYVSDMPAFGQSLSDEDIVAVLAYIKSTWPPKIAAAQREATEHDGAPR